MAERAWDLLAEERDTDLYTAMFKSEPTCSFVLWSVVESPVSISSLFFLLVSVCEWKVVPPVVLAGLRKLEDSWIFEDPVTEAIAPGYFEIVEKPMDYVTVEKKLEASEYHTKEEVGGARSRVGGA